MKNHVALAHLCIPLTFQLEQSGGQGLIQLSSSKNARLHSLPPSVNVDWCGLDVTACKFALKQLVRIKTLTEGGGEATGAKRA